MMLGAIGACVAIVALAMLAVHYAIYGLAKARKAYTAASNAIIKRQFSTGDYKSVMLKDLKGISELNCMLPWRWNAKCYLDKGKYELIKEYLEVENDN